MTSWLPHRVKRRRQEATEQAPWVLVALRAWQVGAAKRRDLAELTELLDWVRTAMRCLRSWRREARARWLLVLGGYVGEQQRYRTALRAWRRDMAIRRPLDAQWHDIFQDGAGQRAVARVLLVWKRDTAAWRWRYQSLGMAYSHWQVVLLSRGMRHWHHIAQLSLDAHLERLLWMQRHGHFDIRQLPGFLAQPLHPERVSAVSRLHASSALAWDLAPVLFQ